MECTDLTPSQGNGNELLRFGSNRNVALAVSEIFRFLCIVFVHICHIVPIILFVLLASLSLDHFRPTMRCCGRYNVIDK